MPDGREVNEEARIGREAAEKACDQEKSCEVVGIMVAQRPAQEPRGDVDAHEVDREQDPGNPVDPVRSDGLRLEFQEQVAGDRSGRAAASDGEHCERQLLGTESCVGAHRYFKTTGAGKVGDGLRIDRPHDLEMSLCDFT